MKETTAPQATQDTAATVRGAPVSGRVWKSIKKRTSSMVPENVKSGWDKRRKEELLRKAVKEHQQELKQAKAEEKVARRQAHIEQEKRKLANAKRAEVTQVVSSRKVKRMSKKQYRAAQIELRAGVVA
ncbi:Ccdc86p [Sorochytrium milnesiophthora]